MAATADTILQSNHLGELVAESGMHSAFKRSTNFRGHLSHMKHRQHKHGERERKTDSQDFLSGKGHEHDESAERSGMGRAFKVFALPSLTLKKKQSSPSIDAALSPSPTTKSKASKMCELGVREAHLYASRSREPLSPPCVTSMSRGPSEYTSSFMERNSSALSASSSRRSSCPDISNQGIHRSSTHGHVPPPNSTPLRDRSHSMAGSQPLCGMNNEIELFTTDSKTFAPKHRTPTPLKSCLSRNGVPVQSSRGRPKEEERSLGATDASRIAHSCAKAVEDRVYAEEQAEVAMQMLVHIRQGVSKGTWTRSELRQAEAVWTAATEKVDDAISKETMYNSVRRGVRASSSGRQ